MTRILVVDDEPRYLRLLQINLQTEGYDIVVPATPDGLQPLHAVYARRCLPVIRGLIEKDRLKITGFYPGHRLLTISPEVIHSFDPEGRIFLNVNTPEDLLNLPSN